MLAALQGVELGGEGPVHAMLASPLNHRKKLLTGSPLPNTSFAQHTVGADPTAGTKPRSGAGHRQAGPAALWGVGVSRRNSRQK